MEKLGVYFSDIPEWAKWKTLLKTGAFDIVIFEKLAFVCRRPKTVKTLDTGVFHCETGMAVTWADGTGTFYLNGVIVPAWVVETPAEKIDPKKVLAEENVDVRRELIRKVGIERFLSVARHEVLDTDGDYALLSVELSEELKNAKYLKMKNPSIGTWHVEGVHEDCATVQDALNYRRYGDGFKNKQNWKPEVMS
jgi:hypothetical protein